MSEFANYKPIISKLRKKKSLLRKTPNLNEVSDELINLSTKLKPFPSYSAYCMVAASRIEHGNNASSTSSETEFDHLLVAARKFDADQDINSAISCYRHAIKLCHESLAYSLLTELARMYQKYERFEEAAIEFMAAGNFRAAGLCYIDSMDHLRALNCYEQIDGVKKFVFMTKSMAENVGDNDPDPKSSTVKPAPSLVSRVSTDGIIEALTQEDQVNLKDDLVTIYLLKLCTINSPSKLSGNFPIIPTPSLLNTGHQHPQNLPLFKGANVESLNIALESLLSLIKDGIYRKNVTFKLMMYKELNPKLSGIQRKLLNFILEKKRV